MTVGLRSEVGDVSGLLAGADLPGARSCAVVACGTSRFIVLGASDLATEQDRTAVVRAVIGSDEASGGLGGGHHQTNKVVLVEDRVGQTVRFRFYQASPNGEHVYPAMECSNAAPAAAVWARLDQGLGTDGVREATYGATNLGTGQSMVLQPASAALWWRNDWTVQFTGWDRVGPPLTGGAESFSLTEGGHVVGGHVVHHGNVFVLAQIRPDQVNPALARRLAALGDDFQGRRRLPRTLTKVVPYEPVDSADETETLSAACFSAGERHHSLPGSAAMVLSAFWTLRNLTAAAGRGDSSVDTSLVTRLLHPSGSLTVRVTLRRYLDVTTVTSTSFSTPVRLLLCGSALV